MNARTRMQFKKLTINDYEEIVSLWTKAGLPFRPRGRDSKTAMKAEMSANPDFFVGAYEDGHLIAVVILSSDRRKGWINRLTVDPDQRHKGIAKALIRESERVLRKTGLKMFCALIDEDNAASKELFKACGYDEHREIIYFSKRENAEI